MNEHWEEVYEAALLEMDQRKMAERIDAATTVLGSALRELSDVPERRHEKAWIEDALRTLQMIRQTELNP
jgi:hypothetical protein